jgi:hypothetical protein
VILSDIKRYLSERGQATLADMALHFQSSPDAVRGMLEVWAGKGKVRRHLTDPSCGSSCSQCDPASVEIYEWIGDGSADKIPVIQPPGDC